MKKFLTRVLLATVLALPARAGTPTPHEPKGFTGPFTDEHIQPDQYRIGMQGNDAADQSMVEYDCLVWAAELTVQSGRRYFLIRGESYVMSAEGASRPGQLLDASAPHAKASKPFVYVRIQTLPDGVTYSLTPAAQTPRAPISSAKGMPQLHLMEYPHLIDSLELLRGAQKAGIKLEPETIAKMKSV